MRSSDSERIHIHVPTPGDHYSPATGSAIMTLIYEMARNHRDKGGETHVIVARGTRHDYDVGSCCEVAFGPPPGKLKKLADVAVGRLRFPRTFGPRWYRPAAESIPRDFAGAIFVHNNPVAIPLFKNRHPGATVCLWANNELFRTYTRREANHIASRADRLICCSEYIANELRSRLDANHHKVRVVRNGVDPLRFQPATQTPPPGIPTVLFLGRMVPEKGPDLLIRAALRIHSPECQFKVRLVGSSGFSSTDPITSYETELRKLAKPLREWVEFHPFVDRHHVLGEYQSASVVCVPSNWDDPCPLNVLEAMACGRPTVAARRGGIPEEGGDALLYFDPPQVDGLATHLAYLIGREDARADWGHRARERAQKISWQLQYEELCNALRN